MPGIWGIVSEKPLKENIDLTEIFHKDKCSSYLEDSINSDKYALGRCSINKFQNDKIFEETENSITCTDGIIFNLKSLLAEDEFSKFLDDLTKAFGNDSSSFIKKLRGNFSGYVYNKEAQELKIFTDHLGSKPIYYFLNEEDGVLIFASEQKVVIEGMRKLGYIPHLSTAGAYCLLTFGFMIGDNTLVAEIKKIPPGNILKYKQNKVTSIEYYRLSSTPYSDEDRDTLIKNLDKLFKIAIKMEYEKDLEYGYKHLATLSGGLDSRMNVANALKLGFRDIACFTFSQSNYLDEIIAKRIASDYHLKFIFYALDNGDYLRDCLDDIINSNDGLILYSGAAHTYACLSAINFCSQGMVHTGQIGDLVMGSYLAEPTHRRVNQKIIEKIAYSKKLLPKLMQHSPFHLDEYENDEIFAFYERCVNGVFNGYRMIEQFTEYSSPFLYLDFLDYAMKIPPSYRYKESIYIRWINTYIPNFAKYKWERYKISPRYPLKLMKLYAGLYYLRGLILGRIFPMMSLSMNPTEHWWKSNAALRDQINALFRENIDAVEENPELFQDCIMQFETGSLLEKTQVITLIRAIKIFNIKVK